GLFIFRTDCQHSRKLYCAAHRCQRRTDYYAVGKLGHAVVARPASPREGHHQLEVFHPVGNHPRTSRGAITNRDAGVEDMQLRRVTEQSVRFDSDAVPNSWPFRAGSAEGEITIGGGNAEMVTFKKH